jgi:subtilisin family serine protease
VNEPPALYDASFSVGATDRSDNIAASSSRGPVTVDGSQRLKPDIVAPGDGIRSSVPTNLYAGGWSGTSMAGPHVAGVVALLISAHPELRGDVDAIEQLIRLTALPRTTTNQTCGDVPGTQVPNNTYGWGCINAMAALGLQDSDGDGMIDWHELLAGTDMRDPASFLHITEIAFTNTTALIRFTSVTNKLYDLEAKDALADSAWSVLATNLAGNDGILESSDPAEMNSVGRLYRLRLVR